jgi:hypothetical protein
MVGHTVVFEPSQSESKSYSKDLERLNSRDINVSVCSAFTRRSISQLKKKRIAVQRCVSNPSLRQVTNDSVEKAVDFEGNDEENNESLEATVDDSAVKAVFIP